MSGGGSATNVLLDVARQEGGVPLTVPRVANSPGEHAMDQTAAYTGQTKTYFVW